MICVLCQTSISKIGRDDTYRVYDGGTIIDSEYTVIHRECARRSLAERSVTISEDEMLRAKKTWTRPQSKQRD